MDLNNEKNPQKGYNLHEINTVYNNIIVIKNNRKKFSGQYKSIRRLPSVNEINSYFYVRCEQWPFTNSSNAI